VLAFLIPPLTWGSLLVFNRSPIGLSSSRWPVGSHESN
jgi:hypothetical protein